jgi:hypothetical protein
MFHAFGESDELAVRLLDDDSEAAVIDFLKRLTPLRLANGERRRAAHCGVRGRPGFHMKRGQRRNVCGSRVAKKK